MRVQLSLSALLFALPVVAAVGCGAPDDSSAFDESEVATDGKADKVDSTYTYYSVRPDYRRCVAPLCGGYYVKKVNSKAAEVYVAEMSFDKAGLDEYDQQTFAVGGAIVRGWVNQKDFGSFGKMSVFAASEVWAAGSGTQTASGTYYKLNDTGIVCAKAPCFNIKESELNDKYRTTLSGVTGDLAGEAVPVLLSDDELLVSGYNRKDKQPSYVTTGKVVEISAYWKKVKHHEGPTCANVKCAAGTTCEMIEVWCFAAPCYPVPSCVMTDDHLVELASKYGFSHGDPTYEQLFFKTEADAYAHVGSSGGFVWVAFDGSNNQFVWGYNDLWAERFSIDRITGDITVTAEH